MEFFKFIEEESASKPNKAGVESGQNDSGLLWCLLNIMGIEL